MTTDQAIVALIKFLKRKKLELQSELSTEEHDCDCIYCDYEEEEDDNELDDDTIIEEIEEIEADIARFSALKLDKASQAQLKRFLTKGE